MQINSSIITFVLHKIVEQIIQHFVFIFHHFLLINYLFLFPSCYFHSSTGLFNCLLNHLLLQILNQPIPIIVVVSIGNSLHFLIHTFFLLWSFQKLYGVLGDSQFVIEGRFCFIELTIDVCIKGGVFKHKEVWERLLIADGMLR